MNSSIAIILIIMALLLLSYYFYNKVTIESLTLESIIGTSTGDTDTMDTTDWKKREFYAILSIQDLIRKSIVQHLESLNINDAVLYNDFRNVKYKELSDGIMYNFESDVLFKKNMDIRVLLITCTVLSREIVINSVKIFLQDTRDEQDDLDNYPNNIKLKNKYHLFGFK